MRRLRCLNVEIVVRIHDKFFLISPQIPTIRIENLSVWIDRNKPMKFDYDCHNCVINVEPRGSGQVLADVIVDSNRLNIKFF